MSSVCYSFFYILIVIFLPLCSSTSTKLQSGAYFLYRLSSFINNVVCFRVSFIPSFFSLLRIITAVKRLTTREVGKRKTVFELTDIFIFQLFHKYLHCMTVCAFDLYNITDGTLFDEVHYFVEVYIFKRFISRYL